MVVVTGVLALCAGVAVALALQDARAQDGDDCTTTTDTGASAAGGFETPACPSPTEPTVTSAPSGTQPPAVLPPPSVTTGFIECRGEGVDLDDLPPPVHGELINVGYVSGEVFYTPEEGETFCLKGAVQLRVGATIDTRNGKIELITEGSIRDAFFFDGVFQVLQDQGADAETVLKLIGALEHCDTASHDSPGGRQLWGDGEGEHRTQGTLGSASVRGTKWLLQDRCNGTTYARVVDGTIELTNEKTGKTITLEAGESHTIRP
jgi:hypothetical protein